MKRLATRPGHHPAVCIAKELRLRRHQIFTFVRMPGVPWHHREAERAIRQGASHRTVAGGGCTWIGATRFHARLSVFEKRKKTGENFVALLERSLVQGGDGRTPVAFRHAEKPSRYEGWTLIFGRKSSWPSPAMPFQLQLQ